MITVMIASIPIREKMLEKTVESIRKQSFKVDNIKISLNNYKTIPKFLDISEVILMDNRLTDANKFYMADKFSGYLLTCDDDLIYPSNYVAYMISGVDKYKCACTLHGKLYPKKFVNFQTTQANFTCLNDVLSDGRVDVGGTGVMAWHSDFLKVKYSEFKSKNMADLWFAKICHEQNVKIICLAHQKGNLVYQGPEHTIWEEEKSKGFVDQTKLLKSFLC